MSGLCVALGVRFFFGWFSCTGVQREFYQLNMKTFALACSYSGYLNAIETYTALDIIHYYSLMVNSI